MSKRRMPRARAIAAAAALFGASLGFLGAAAPVAAVGPTDVGVYAKWTVSGAPNALHRGRRTAGLHGLRRADQRHERQHLVGRGIRSERLPEFQHRFRHRLRVEPTAALLDHPAEDWRTRPGAAERRHAAAVAHRHRPRAARGADWGFALGDVDADWVFVTAYDDGGAQLPVAALGAMTPANYCAAGSPKPSACAGPGPFTDAPRWVASGTLDDFGISFVAGTLVGNFDDTAGAYLGFQPDPSVRRIELLYGAVNGSPSYQLWLAAAAAKATISGTVTLDGGGPPPAGTVVEVNDSDGEPVLDELGEPVSTPVDGAGAFTIELPQADGYELVVVPPPGFVAPAPVTVDASQAVVAVPPITVAAAVAPSPGPGSPGAAQPALAESGFAGGPWLIVGGAILLAGLAVVIVVAVRRRRVPGEETDAAGGASPDASGPSNDGPAAS